MGNIRGNTWSKNHETLEPCSNCSAFWDFNWDTSGHHDYPAMIDYVLDSTGFEDLFFVGYSMGTTQYFVLLSELPEYNDKIRAGFLMGPAAYMGNAYNPIFQLADYAEDLQELFHLLGE